MAHTQAQDLWLNLVHDMLGFTFHHNAFHNYRAKLDKWHLFYARLFSDFTLQITLDHSLTISNHAPVWLTLNLGIPTDDLPVHTIHLKHTNAAYF